jgi:hypothetical protein
VSIFLLASTGLASGHGSRALGPGSAEELHALLGNDSFTATAEVEQGYAGGETRMQVLYYYEPGKVRLEWDDSKNSGTRTEALADRRQKGLDLRVEITRFDQNRKYVIYPRRKAYYEVPLGKGEAIFKPEPGQEGAEEVDGHRCSRSRATVGPEAVVIWRALDLKQFPIQMRTTHGEYVSTLRFQHVRRLKLSPSLFEVPAAFRKFDDLSSLVRAPGS